MPQANRPPDDIRTFFSWLSLMQDSLVVLDASGNGMGGAEIERILDLYRLETLNLADNEINEMAQVRSCTKWLFSSSRVKQTSLADLRTLGSSS